MSRDPVVDGSPPGPFERFRDGLGRSVRSEAAPELMAGTPAAQAPGPEEGPDLAAPPPQTDDDAGLASIPASWKPWVIGPLVLAFALFHVAPHLADMAGDPRAVLGRLFGPLPFGDTLGGAAAGWLWEPVWVWLGAMALRLRALQRMVRDPPGAVTMALIAVAFETGFWVFMGRGQTGAWSPAEASALILMLKIEGAVMLGLVFLFLPTGKRKLGETDAHWNRG
ncbi:MAG: hypothetical protein K0R83_296 [Caulobacter sp.]|jgi:hypothetical protein|nr:hypothetical protein [Caulobacter sp.]